MRRIGGLRLRVDHRMVVGVDKGLVQLALTWQDGCRHHAVLTHPTSVRHLIQLLTEAVDQAERYRRETITQ